MEVRLLDVMSYGIKHSRRIGFMQILQLVKLILVIPIHTAECE